MTPPRAHAGLGAAEAAAYVREFRRTISPRQPERRRPLAALWRLFAAPEREEREDAKERADAEARRVVASGR